VPKAGECENASESKAQYSPHTSHSYLTLIKERVYTGSMYSNREY
jgi:hypothetical protein